MPTTVRPDSNRHKPEQDRIQQNQPNRNPPQQILIIGASVRHCAQSASQLGIECLAVDLFSDWDLRQVAGTMEIESFSRLDVGKLMNQLDSIPDHFIFCGGMEKRVKQLVELSKFSRLVGTQPNDITKTNCPSTLSEVCNDHRILFPKTTNVEPELADDCTNWLLKPLLSAGGCQIKVWQSGDVCAKPYNGIVDVTTRDFFWQRRIAGRSFSSVFCGEEQVVSYVGSTEQLIGDESFGVSSGSFTYCGSIGPISFSQPIVSELKRIGNALAQEFNLIGVFGIDWVVDDRDNIWLIEINPRLTASCELFEMAGVCDNIVGMHLRSSFRTDKPERKTEVRPKKTGKVFGKAIVYNPSSPITIDDECFRFFSSNAKWHSDRDQRIVADTMYADIPKPGTRIRNGSPVITIFVSASSRDQCLIKLRSAANNVHQQTNGPQADSSFASA